MNFTSDYIELNLLHEVFIYFMYKHGVNIFANILHDFYMNFTLNLINYMSFSYISCIYMERRSGERRAGRAGPGSCGGPTVIVRLAEHLDSCHLRCRTSRTMSYVMHVRHRTCDVRHRVEHRTYDVVRAIYRI